MNVTIGKVPVDAMTDKDIVEWMQEVKGGYRLRPATAAIWVAVLRSLDQQGPPMTVRGLFYNCENVYHVVGKTEQGYEQVAAQVLAMRRAGVLPYSFIADNTRWMRKPRTYDGLAAFFEEGAKAYRRALWTGRNVYVEVWCEKDAIAGILREITDEWDVPLLVVRGYSSETFAFNAAEQIKSMGKETYIYYFGDWDPHGVGISRDIERKLRGFGARFSFTRVAVTGEQVRSGGLPTRPPKAKDPKSRTWLGPCVEVDAVPANTLRDMVRSCIERHVDREFLERTRKAEEAERATLRAYEGTLKQLGVSPQMSGVP